MKKKLRENSSFFYYIFYMKCYIQEHYNYKRKFRRRKAVKAL